MIIYKHLIGKEQMNIPSYYVKQAREIKDSRNRKTPIHFYPSSLSIEDIEANRNRVRTYFAEFVEYQLDEGIITYRLFPLNFPEAYIITGSKYFIESVFIFLGHSDNRGVFHPILGGAFVNDKYVLVECDNRSFAKLYMKYYKPDNFDEFMGMVANLIGKY